MDNEIDLDLQTEGQEEINREKSRNKALSEKVKLANEEKDKFAKEKEQAELEKAAALKEVDFFKNFTPLSSKYQGAAEYQDQIHERVLKGYDVEEATLAVLAKEGKLIQPIAPSIPKQSPAGGSAPNTIQAGGNKAIGEMTQAERRAQLLDAEKAGDIALS